MSHDFKNENAGDRSAVQRQFLAVAVSLILFAESSVFANPPTTGQKPAASEPAIYSGRTLEEWKRISLHDLDPDARIDSIVALVAFAKNGYEKEAVAAIKSALEAPMPSGKSLQDLSVAYEAISTLGNACEPLLVAALKSSSDKHQRAAVMALTEVRTEIPQDALTEALLEKVGDQKVHWLVRGLACSALSRPLQYQAVAKLRAAAYRKEKEERPQVALDTTRAEPYLKQVVPVLEKALHDTNRRVSDAAAVSLLHCIKQRPALVATVLDYYDAQLTKPAPQPSLADLGIDEKELEARRLARNMEVQRQEATRRLGTRRTISSRGANSWGAGSLGSELFSASQLHPEEMQRSLKQLKSLRDRHPNRYELDRVIQNLEPSPSGVGRGTTFEKPAPDVRVKVEKIAE